MMLPWTVVYLLLEQLGSHFKLSVGKILIIYIVHLINFTCGIKFFLI